MCQSYSEQHHQKVHQRDNFYSYFQATATPALTRPSMLERSTIQQPADRSFSFLMHEPNMGRPTSNYFVTNKSPRLDGALAYLTKKKSRSKTRSKTQADKASRAACCCICPTNKRRQRWLDQMLVSLEPRLAFSPLSFSATAFSEAGFLSFPPPRKESVEPSSYHASPQISSQSWLACWVLTCVCELRPAREASKFAEMGLKST
ncbi:hypothetical protein F5144DRAFT_261424 [Chaetomium tenue]|uniref:Uncharacterized protein n=1 Tax=Chaetomium tenue TaxID=1854479 RepID=A0ACB7P9K3_9PEZI|nr:hypothetical protein F5144DRAFT_261424 [Chaetomium globosum]